MYLDTDLSQERGAGGGADFLSTLSRAFRGEEEEPLKDENPSCTYEIESAFGFGYFGQISFRLFF